MIWIETKKDRKKKREKERELFSRVMFHLASFFSRIQSIFLILLGSYYLAKNY